jgi:hypothetical protein
MSKLPAYYIQSNLSEKQIEADVATYMGWCTRRKRPPRFACSTSTSLRRVQTNSAMLGLRYYMQFKKSDGLRPTQKASTRKNKSKLEDVREFRREHGLDDNPSLFFQLRVQAKNAEQLQHNVLLAYERPPLSRAIYVAPLLLDKTQYHSALFVSKERFLDYPFFYRHRQAILHEQWASHFSMIPFLREHISIPPHERVATHEHYFSFSEAGVDVAWHSGDVITREPSRLSDFVSSFFTATIVKEDGLGTIDALAAAAEEIANANAHEGRFDGESSVERLMNHGKWLREKHGIRQFLLLGHSGEMRDWRTNGPV